MAKQADTHALVSDIEQTRMRIADTLDQLVDRTNPKNIARRTAADVKAHFVSPDGGLRLENVVPVVVGVVGVVGALVLVRRIVR